jgi:hypothetical protein
MLDAAVATVQVVSALFLALGAALCLFAGRKKEDGSGARREALDVGQPDG